MTQKAAEMIKYQLGNSSVYSNDSALRIKIIGGGCSGLRYNMSFDKNINKDSDYIKEEYGVRLVIDEKSALYMVGSQLDFVDELMETGFKINNPNAKNSCGCGESFGV